MPGGFNPYSTRYGSSRHTAEETILNALNEGVGTGLTKDQQSYSYAENFAYARALADLWSANRRLSYQWSAQYMTDMLPRWETILGLQPASTDTDATRRAAVAVALSFAGKPGTQQAIRDALAAALGSVFVGLVHQSTANETAHVIGGLSIPGGVTLTDGPWGSTVNNLTVHVEKPAAVSPQQFLASAGLANRILDQMLPVWSDYSFYQNDSASAMGFLLDEPNLDIECFGL